MDDSFLLTDHMGLIVIQKVMESCYTMREDILSNIFAADKKPIESYYLQLNLRNEKYDIVNLLLWN